MKNLLLKRLALMTVLFLPVTAALASSEDIIRDTDRHNAAVSDDFRAAVVGFMNYFLSFLGLIAVIMVVYAGILLVTAQGDEQQINKGKKIILWAAIGMLIIMLSYAIVQVIAGAGDFVGQEGDAEDL